MNLPQDYLRKLEARNGYCGCPNLRELFEKRKQAEILELICNGFQSESDMDNPRQEDSAFLGDYKRNAEELNKAAEQYHVLLTETARRGELRFVLHDPAKAKPIGKIDYREVPALVGDGSDVIISVHCSSCNQQIDIAD